MSLKRVLPSELTQEPILLSDVYSFARRRSGRANRLIRLQVKLLTLLGERVTFAGSTLLRDPFTIDLFNEMSPAFEEGLIVPDLRDEAESFEHLAELREQKGVTKDLRGHVRRLDTKIKQVISFDADEVSDLYYHGLIGIINELIDRAPDPRDREIYHAIKETLAASPGRLTLEYVKSMGNTLERANSFKRLAELLYCITGGEVVGATILIPGCFIDEKTLWRDLIPQGEFSAPQLQAFEALLRYYAIDITKLEFLSSEEIVDLRQDIRLGEAVSELKKIAADARATLILDPELASDYKKATIHLSRTIEEIVGEACKFEVKKDKVFYWVWDLAWDFSGLPFSNLTQRLVKTLTRRLSSIPYIRRLAYSGTPLSDVAAVLQDSLLGAKTESRSLAVLEKK